MRVESKITVAVRKRPLNRRETEKKDVDIVDAGHPKMLLVKEIRQKLDLTKYVDEHKFIFDAVFSEQAPNEHMYEALLKPLVIAAFGGAKVNCIAFGQTGSGKTYTMMGTLDNSVPGMYYLAARDIFALADSPSYGDISVTVGFFEIYCGKAYDLLNNRELCPIREDGQDNVNIVGLCEAAVSSIEGLMKTIQFGLSMRITGQTGMNDDSSRSHAILHINLKQGNKLAGRMSFIDLAGSERGADVVDTDKQTRIDGAEINKSLLALKECIRALDLNKRHLPFRGSKLTLVLKDSFIGNCRTVMIGNISPGQTACEHTLNTLRYADRVKELKKTSASCEKTSVSKDDMLAKALMLPRMPKDSQQTKLVEEKANELNLVKPFEQVIGLKTKDGPTEKKTNIKDKFLGSKMTEVRRSQGAATLSALIGLNATTSLTKERVSMAGNNTVTTDATDWGTRDRHENSSTASEPLSQEVRAVRVTRLNLDGNPSHATSLSQTQFSRPSDTYQLTGASKASSPEITRTAVGLRTLGQNVIQTGDKQSFLKKNPTQSDITQSHVSKLSPVLDPTAFQDEKPPSTVMSTSKANSTGQKTAAFTSNPTSNKATSKVTVPSKSKSFLQPSDFIQSLKADKNGTRKAVEGIRDSSFRANTHSETSLSSKHTFSKISGVRKAEEKKENGPAASDLGNEEALADFQVAYENHISELKGILAKDEAILNEMKRQKNLTSTGLALFMDAWKNLLNQKIRQVNGWKEKIKAVEASAVAGKGGNRFVTIGNGLTKEDCIVEESLFDGEEV